MSSQEKETPPYWRAHKVCVTQGQQKLLRDVDAMFERGRMCAILGPNGAGKSTLLRVLSGVHKTTQGHVSVHTKAMEHMSIHKLARLRHVIFQTTPQVFDFTVLELVLMGRHASRDGWSIFRSDVQKVNIKQARMILDELGLLSMQDRLATTLSGGELQRVWFARALFSDTPWWMFDEPTSHMDLKHKHTLMSRARKHCDDGGSGIFVLHDLNLVERYCDDVLLLHQGKVVMKGRCKEVLCAQRLEKIFDVVFSSEQVHGVRVWSTRPREAHDDSNDSNDS